MTVFARFKTILVLVLSAIFVYVGLLNLVDRREWRTPWDGINWIQTPKGVEVKSLKSLRVVSNTALSKGDRLISINNIPIRTLDDHTEVLELLAETLPVVKQANYLMQDAHGTTTSRTVEIGLKTETRFVDIALALVALTHLLIGVFIFLRNFRAQGAFHFYLICSVAFVLYMYRYSGRADAFDVTVYWFIASAFLVLPPLFLHFCCYFPQPLSWVKHTASLKYSIYLPSFFMLGVHILWFIGSLEILGLPRNVSVGNMLDRVHLSHFIIFFMMGAVALVCSSRQGPSAIQRLQMKWVTRGTLCGVLPFLCVYAVPFVGGLSISAYMEASVLGLILVPVSFGYAITKHRLTDVKVIFKQGATYVLASSALLGLYVGIVLLIGRAIQGFAPQSGFLLFALSALLVAFLFAPLKNKIQNQIDRYLYRDRYNYRRSLAEFGRSLGSEIRLDSLTERISERLHQTLNVAPIGIFLRDDRKTDVYHPFHLQDFLKNPKVLTIPNTIFSDFDRQLNPLFLLPPSEAVEKVRHELSQLNLHYLQPLRVRGKMIGFLTWGKRLNGEFLSSEDLDLIGTLSDYAAIAIDNALLYYSLETKAGELAQLKAYSDNVVRSITVGVLVLNPEGEITVCNDSMQTLCGMRSEAVIGKNISEVLSKDFLQTLEKLVPGPPWTVEETSWLYKTRLVSTEGRTGLVNVTISPFILQGDVVTGILLAFEDITEKVQLENQLLQAEKLSSIGLLSAGIAHEVNTPLTAISSYTQMLLKNTSTENPDFRVLKKIEKQGFRAANIVNNLLNFARVGDSDIHEVNVNSLMLDTLSLLDHQFRKANLEIAMDLDPTIPSTLANTGKLQQVFMNLFMNARDAMPQGGQIDIKTYEENSVLVVEVQDRGRGISEQDMKRIFDPFFTTKDVGEGTGLGLSVSYGIIQELSGRIQVESRPGKGTVFQLRLPVKRIN